MWDRSRTTGSDQGSHTAAGDSPCPLNHGTNRVASGRRTTGCSTRTRWPGATSARLCGIKAVDPGAYRAVPKDYESRMTEELKTVLEFGQLKVGDNLSRMKETYAALAVEPDHTRYGWIRVRS